MASVGGGTTNSAPYEGTDGSAPNTAWRPPGVIEQEHVLPSGDKVKVREEWVILSFDDMSTLMRSVAVEGKVVAVCLAPMCTV